MKRLGLFVFYDKDGIVDDYVIYLLKDLMNNLDHLSIVSNSKIQEKEKEKFYQFTDDIIIRENKGLDAGALYDYFNTRDDYFGYDEIVVLNDTFYGPLYPFKEVFEKMDKREELDFWGLTKGYKQIDGWNRSDDGYLPEHIQTFFIVFRSSVINSDAFKDYWAKYDINNMNTFVDVVSGHETQFTKYLYEHGFKYDSYVQDSKLDLNPKRNYCHYAYNTSQQVIVDNAPFIKRKNFVFSFKEFSYYIDDPNLKNTLNFIKNNTNYDISLIWKNLLRLYNIDDIRNTIGFNEIIKPSEHNIEVKNTLVVRLDNIYNVQDVIKRIDYFDRYIIYSSNDKIIDIFKKKNIKIKKINKNFKSLFLDDLKSIKTDYMTFLDFEDNKNAINLVSIEKNETILNNLVKDKNYINGLLNKLNNDKNIGMVYAPDNISLDNFYQNISWDKLLLKELRDSYTDFNKKIDKDKLPVSVSTSFVCKTSILKSVDKVNFNKINNKFFIQAFSILLSYLGTDSYMYPIIGMNEEYAIYKLNLESYINKSTYKNLYEHFAFPRDYLNVYNTITHLTFKRIVKLSIRKTLSKNKRWLLNHIYYPIRNRFKKYVLRRK